MTTKTIYIQTADNQGVAVQTDFKLTGSFGPPNEYSRYDHIRSALTHAAEALIGIKSGEAFERDGKRYRLNLSVSVWENDLHTYTIADSEGNFIADVEGTVPSDALGSWAKANIKGAAFVWYEKVEGSEDCYKASQYPEVYRVTLKS